MNAIDTAPVYGFGRSEEVVGRALEGRRDRALVFTKCGLRWDSTEGAFDFDMVMPDGASHAIHRNLRPESVRAECEASLRRLGIETIDLLQCHWPDPGTPIPETMGAMRELHREGKIRAVGVSNFSVEQLDETIGSLGDVPLASTQPRYSLLNRVVERDVLPWCRERGVGVIVYSPIEQGLLSGKVTADRTFDEGDLRPTRKLFRPEHREAINDVVRDHLIPLAQSHGATPVQVAIAWVVHQPGMTAAIVGTRTPQQARENAAAGDLELTPDDVRRLSEAFGALEVAKP